jgi:hypothetical protein
MTAVTGWIPYAIVRATQVRRAVHSRQLRPRDRWMSGLRVLAIVLTLIVLAWRRW